ncbi:MAG: hypothetical protein QNJ70_16280 [Xenococcaceae cyanobacterium MO_207.B15]|nr:hypothetical protein [Xenococcaceae cyanobacterium MO_207.B15]
MKQVAWQGASDAPNDCIVYEDLSVKNLVRNRKLSKSISDAG